MAQNSKSDDELGVQTLSRPKSSLRPPRMYKVILHNDDYTTRDFVVDILCHVFGHAETVAIQIMLQVHTSGSGVAGIYTHEIAETKIHTVDTLAKENEFPLKLSLEPEGT
ncbi:MAG: ATP-dependent Clp protease adaptor ClpS [Myxococcales bacterium]|nr:MAG: ATP-dependent Clp protease adaptor ClpS [Myxococcales bacterium]